MNSAMMDFIRAGLAAVAFILLAKFLFVTVMPIPGLTQVVASV